ncbi:MAG TPA: class I SAM-dependent methyltransferase [Firmicutes bacterium]|nr:class I SAM-dependent methyltransferase [Bacillota bacterium]
MGFPSGWLVALNHRKFRFVPPSDDPIAYARKQLEDGKRVWTRFFADKVPISGKLVLDLGCGPGGKTCGYVALNPERIIGVDISYDAIAQAEKARDILVHPENRHKLEFACVDAEDLPFPDEYFDVVTCSDSFEHFPNPQKVLSEARRVLKVNGLMAIDFAQWKSYNGHHLGDIITTPWSHVFWSKEAVIEAVGKLVEMEKSHLKDEKSLNLLEDFKVRRIEHFINALNGLSIASFEGFLKSDKRLKVHWSRKTSAYPVLFPLIFIPGLRELAVARNVYVIERIGL